MRNVVADIPVCCVGILCALVALPERTVDAEVAATVAYVAVLPDQSAEAVWAAACRVLLSFVSSDSAAAADIAARRRQRCGASSQALVTFLLDYLIPLPSEGDAAEPAAGPAAVAKVVRRAEEAVRLGLVDVALQARPCFVWSLLMQERQSAVLLPGGPVGMLSAVVCELFRPQVLRFFCCILLLLAISLALPTA